MQKIEDKKLINEIDKHLQKKNIMALRTIFSTLSNTKMSQPELMQRLGLFYYIAGKDKDCFDLYFRLINNYPAIEINYFNFLNILMEKNKIQDTSILIIKLAKIACDKHPYNYRLVLKMSTCLLDKGESEISRLSFKKLYDSNLKYANDVPLLLKYGEAQLKSGIFNLGIRELEQALDLLQKIEEAKIKDILMGEKKEILAILYGQLIRAYYLTSQSQKFNKMMTLFFKSNRYSAYQNLILVEYYEKASQLDKLKIMIDETKVKYPESALCDIYEVIYYRRKKDTANVKKYLEQISFSSLTTFNLQISFYLEKAKLNENIKKYQLAFEYYLKASEIKILSNGGIVKNKKFGKQQRENILLWKKMIPYFANNFNNKLDEKDSLSDAPIFFVGFPRSGTTLIDQILSAHKQVEVIEEKPILSVCKEILTQKYSIYPHQKIADLNQLELNDIRNKYYTELSKYAQNKKSVIVDKLPLNLIQLPLILKLFPQAKIIVAIRHPMDSILSCFMQYFDNNPAMSNLIKLTDASNFYQNVMRNYLDIKKLYKIHFHEIRYEDLIINIEKEAKLLFKYLELPWDEQILNYQKNAKNKIINTPSYSQVTQPIYITSRYKWKNYEQNIGDYMASLKDYIKAFGY